MVQKELLCSVILAWSYKKFISLKCLANTIFTENKKNEEPSVATCMFKLIAARNVGSFPLNQIKKYMYLLKFMF